MEWITILAIGFGLGIKHAVEPDHAIAVSTIASVSKNLWRSSLAGIFWGIGHTVTLLAVGMIFIMLKGEVPEIWALSLEFLVGIMLVYLGVISLLAYRKGKLVHSHTHEHRGGSTHVHYHSHRDQPAHVHEHPVLSYKKSFLVGFVHGLAGSAAMVILAMGTADTFWQGGLYILVFGAGTSIGMMIFTTLIGIPFVLSAKHVQINGVLTRFTGWVSAAFGILYMYNVGVADGLFRMWLNAL